MLSSKPLSATNESSLFTVKHLGLIDYAQSWQAMKDFTQQRDEQTQNEIWFCEHPPVFTLGQAGKPEHILDAHDIPIVKSDRGGQVTYHGPGFLMIYCLFNLNQFKLNSRDFVCLLEKIIIDTLAEQNIDAKGDRDAPGVYVKGEKIASLGLRIRKGYTYHGICVNVNGDLTPFQYINPCGIENQKMTSLHKQGCQLSPVQLSELISNNLNKALIAQ